LSICCRQLVPGLERFELSVESTIYFCCVEALQNVAKHAGPDARAVVEVLTSGNAVRFRVSDDGIGFDPRAVRPGHGLVNLGDRVAALGGTIEFDSTLGRGATVQGEIPLP